MNKRKNKSEKKKVNLIEKIRFFLRNDFFKNKFVIWGLFLAFLLNVINWVILKIWIVPVDLPIVLHYNVYFGVDILGNWKNVFISPILAISLFFLNLLLGFYFYKKKERIASYIFILGNLMLQFCFVVYSVSLIMINY